MAMRDRAPPSQTSMVSKGERWCVCVCVLVAAPAVEREEKKKMKYDDE